MSKITTHTGLIDALGGTARVARLFGVGLSAVSNWRSDGIPASRHYDLARLAEREGLELDESALFPSRVATAGAAAIEADA